MYFTRDPVIETVITAREGYKLSIRNSKHVSQDPFIVEAVEVVSVGKMGFFRNCDRTKPFLVPVSDYEVMEIRDARINLKAVGLEKGVKIAGGREALLKLSKPVSKAVSVDLLDSQEPVSEENVNTEVSELNKKSPKKDFSSKSDKWKEKKRQGRKKSGKDVSEVADSSKEVLETVAEEVLEEQEAEERGIPGKKKFSLLPPPSKLISEVFSKEESTMTTTSSSEEVFPDESFDVNLDNSLEVLASEGNDGVAAILEKGEAVSDMFSFDSEDSVLPDSFDRKEDSFS
ncbi:hypothetical protein [Chlamydiifrater phoenicopteri]|uniref:hypothetical protein n=1 Tax=Chlamydiifrater phoenicopteri TaxID=2681469 RepID=UPI001BCB5A67|nr:hypothetical protein [Chlamydiifrater phoenicopteri]